MALYIGPCIQGTQRWRVYLWPSIGRHCTEPDSSYSSTFRRHEGVLSGTVLGLRAECAHIGAFLYGGTPVYRGSPIYRVISIYGELPLYIGEALYIRVPSYIGVFLFLGVPLFSYLPCRLRARTRLR